LPNLLLGPYRLEAALPGFRTFVQSGIVLQINANPVINPVLEVGQVAEDVNRFYGILLECYEAQLAWRSGT
jgi:hypothetical protein